jgi:hypothetical protein
MTEFARARDQFLRVLRSHYEPPILHMLGWLQRRLP